jgi:hypothetical protein
MMTLHNRRPWRRNLIALVTVAAALMIPATAAQAEWHFTKRGAEKVAKDFVAKEYANTYTYNLTSLCRPQGRPYNPRYKYHRWVCAWYDSSDGTSGKVLIVGSNSPGAYYGKVLRGARVR